jgi:hypothetical protein
LETTKAATADSLNTSSPEITRKINYQQLATEHAELITSGKTSVEIAQWL